MMAGIGCSVTGGAVTGECQVLGQVLVDFDGTIATIDTTDALLTRFADPAWEQIERAWKAGDIGSRECMVRQVDLVRATPADYAGFLETIEIDPTFVAFVEFAENLGFQITVVSDGLDATVRHVLDRHGLALPIAANHFQHLGDDRWRLSFPHGRSGCRALAGTCKCAFAERSAGGSCVLIGDGRSDFCVAGEVDLVLAKASLLAHARAHGLVHLPFQTFADAQRLLSAWLAERARTTDANPSVRVPRD
jgi:2-hydroxy-3-keto-5-methylthiopentenyl-1-phosphate phosphatase